MSELLKGAADANMAAMGATTPGGARLIRKARGYDIDPVGHARKRKITYTLLGFAVPALLLILWETSSRNGWIDKRLYPAPTECLEQLRQMFDKRDFMTDLRLSLSRLLWGWFWGSLIGVAVAYVMGMSRIVRAALEPLLNALYTVPKLALLSIFLIIFGFGEKPVIIVVAVSVFFFAWVPTQADVMNVGESYREAAKSFGASRWQMFRHVIFPSTLPGLFVTLRVSASVSVLTMIGAEFAFAPQSRGLGYQINNARQVLEPKVAYAGILVAALIGVIFQAVVRQVGRVVVRWEKADKGAPVT
jgi:sulfonate transport system permease protein